MSEVYKVSYSPKWRGGGLIKCVGEEYQVVKRGRKYNGFKGKNITWKKGKENQYHLSYDTKAPVGKNIKWGRGEGWKYEVRKSRFQNMGWGRISRKFRKSCTLYNDI